MEPEYDERGNIPGPGPSRTGTIPNDSPLGPDEQGLANVKKLAWEGFKWKVPGGSIADVFFDQDQRGDLRITKPNIRQAAHPAIQLVAQKAGSEFFNTRIEKLPTQKELVSSTIDEVQNIPSKDFNQIVKVNKESGFSTKDLGDNYSIISQLFKEQATVNFEDKGGFLNVDNWTIPQGKITPRQDTISKIGGKLWKPLQEIDKLRITEVLTDLEDYHQRGLQGQNQRWTAQKPTRGFTGNRVVTTSNGTEIGIAWDGKNQSYRLFDVQKARARASGRYQADKAADDPLSWLKGKSRKGAIKIKNRDALAALDRIKD